MNSFELNKIMGAVLGTLLFVMGVGFIAEYIYHPIEDRGPGYALPEPEGVATAAADVPAEEPIAILLASASAENGATLVRRCQSCHTFEEGGGNRAGPELYGVVGRIISDFPGYAYSPILEQYGEEGQAWTYENLNAFLTNPQTFAPGSKMNLAVRTGEERADILAYLQTLSASPVPFPAPEEVPADVDTAVPIPEGEAVDEPVEAPGPDAVVPSATTPQSDTVVQGTPTTSGTPAATTEGGAPPADAAVPAEDVPQNQLVPAN